MGEYSLEPPRTDLILHLPLDAVSATDTSPQANDGSVVGEPTIATGTVGPALDFDGTGSQYIDLPNGLLTTSDDFTISFGFRVTGETGSGQRILSLRGDLELTTEYKNGDLRIWTGTFRTVQSIDIETDYIVDIAYDDADGEFVVRVDGDEKLRFTDSTTSSSLDNKLGIETSLNGLSFKGRADDLRIYDELLSVDVRNDLYRIRSEKTAFDEAAAEWTNDAMPLIKGRGNARLAGSLMEGDAEYFRQLDAILDGRHINQASGEQLDRIGKLPGVRRKENESDDKYRARIKAAVIAARSSGTTDDVIQNAARLIQTTVDRVEVQFDYDTFPGRVEIFLRTNDVDEIEITASEISTIMEDLVPAGHRVKVTEQGANPFTVINDTMANDPSEGLTSDSISTGGGLVSDV